MNIKSILACMFLALIFSACVEEDPTYDEINTNLKIDVKEATKGNDPGKDEPEPC